MRADADEAYVGLGSNLDGPVGHIRQALLDLDGLPRSRLLRRSALYLTPPLGPPGQPDYVNAVAVLGTRLSPLALLARLRQIEFRHGRRREGERWGARTLDLDLLLMGERVVETERLRLPHPELHRRAFVLRPLADVAQPTLIVPGKGPLGKLLGDSDSAGIHRLLEAV